MHTTAIRTRPAVVTREEQSSSADGANGETTVTTTERPSSQLRINGTVVNSENHKSEIQKPSLREQYRAARKVALEQEERTRAENLARFIESVGSGYGDLQPSRWEVIK